MGYRTPFSSRYPSPPRYAEGGDCRAFVQIIFSQTLAKKATEPEKNECFSPTVTGTVFLAADTAAVCRPSSSENWIVCFSTIAGRVGKGDRLHKILI